MATYLPACQRYAWSRTASSRLGDDMVMRNFRNLGLDKVNICLACDYPHVLRRTKRQEPVVGLLDHRASHAHDIHKLLRHGLSAHRPEATSYAACHYDYMGVHLTSCGNYMLQEPFPIP